MMINKGEQFIPFGYLARIARPPLSRIPRIAERLEAGVPTGKSDKSRDQMLAGGGGGGGGGGLFADHTFSWARGAHSVPVHP
jgi:hypothetical protein